uniref:histidine kinase n=1 Tax=Chromera velia CCMP2878 TaxID=1169474 RepID=A0A0G4HHH7_9ALVE|eukprot:Cvel_27501.t1-p1 / transcript=Cvel_27501.t1 / gene=Cvel_27501 / organism=Chromera_velia_CCMP2878 / gene_product=hypothetical protein / transcript_product=hypothetical protein / location=Cvel_scaffold3441:684-3625(-) / protein_length=821 / sequence_SO=supercontig / SO=protein_coding / is_pseudo=false
MWSERKTSGGPQGFHYIDGNKHVDQEAIRSNCFEKQRKFTSSTLIPTGIVLLNCQTLLAASGILGVKSAVPLMGAVAALIVAVYSGPAAPSSVRGRELQAFVGMWTGSVLLHTGMCLWDAPSKEIYLISLGYTGLAFKVFLIVFHFSDSQFWVLNLTDTLLWWVSVYYGCGSGAMLWGGSQTGQKFAVIVAATGIGNVGMTVGVKKLVNLILREAAEEVMLRRTAESCKDKFLSYIMHEMRNPLSGACLLVFEFQQSVKELLLLAQRDSHTKALRADVTSSALRLQELSRFLSSQTEKMRGVCDDMLQLEKLEKGGLEYAFKPIPIRTWVSNLAGQASTLFETRKGGRSSGLWPRRSPVSPAVSFSWNVLLGGQAEEELLEQSPVGVADFVRLDQVVSNFISNSLKFTKNGKVQLECAIRLPSEAEQKKVLPATPAILESSSLSGDTKLQQWAAAVSMGGNEDCGGGSNGELKWVVMRISVSDTGPGLSEEDQAKLFKPYGQVRAGELQNGGGTGLGLVICKSFVEAHMGGQIGVESEGRGKGSTFFCEIFVPLLDARHAARQGDETSGGAGCLTSKTDSSPGSLSLLRNDSPSFSRVGQSAPVTLDRRFSCPAAVSMASPSSAATSLLKSPTASPSASPAGVGRDKRVYGDPPSPKRSPSATTSRRKQDMLPLPPSNQSQPPSADVLLVDDDRFCLVAGAAAVKRLGFSVVAVEDGEDAVDLIVGRRGSFRLVLIDKNMARLDGIQTVQRLVKHFAEIKREKQETSGNNPSGGGQVVPLIVGCTGDAVKDSHDAFLTAGADKVMIKPLQAQNISNLLKAS